MSILNIFGPAITGTMNARSRVYRRIKIPFFGDITMRNVWAKTLESVQVALRVLETDSNTSCTQTLRPMCARLSLYVINAVCFDNRQDANTELHDGGFPLAGHKMTYSQAMHAILDHMPVVYLFGSSILSTSSNQSGYTWLRLTEHKYFTFSQTQRG